MVIKISKEKVILLAILGLAFFLRTYRMHELMAFGGDVARDFLAARDMTFKGQIPLIGSPTSVPWLYQGAFFTYVLGIVLWAAKYNPLAGGYFVGVMGVLGVWGVYFLGKKLFSEKVGLLSAFFYATSPLIVIFDRYPYHQSLISIFTIFFIFSLWKMTKNIKYTILSFFLFGLLMQLELSNLALLPVLLIWLLVYRKQIQFKLLVLSVFAFLFTWLPKIIYDFSNGFTQTFGFIAWAVHKLPLVNLLTNEPAAKKGILEIIGLMFTFLSRIIFWPSPLLSGFLLLGAVGSASWRMGVVGGMRGEERRGRQLLLLWILAPFFVFFIQGSPSDSYIPVLFGVVSLLVGVCASLARRRLVKLATISLVVFLGIFNGYLLLSNDFFIKTGKSSVAFVAYNLDQSFELNKKMARFIISDAGGQKFNIIALGSFGNFSSSILNLNYLTWYFGNEPSEGREKIQYFIYNKEDNIKVGEAQLVQEFPYLVVARKTRK